MNFPLKKVSRVIATEMIDIQDSSFGEHLENIIEKIYVGVSQGEYSSYDELIKTGYVKELEQLIFRRTGLQVETIVSQDPAAILSFFINKNTIFLKPFWRGSEFSIKEQQEIINKAQGKKGFVDLKKARVGGLFSEYKNKLFINFHLLIKEYRLTTSEIVAIIMHELGHAFYMCEFSDRLESTNQVLANVAKSLMRDDKQKQLTYIYQEIKSIDSTVKEETINDIISGNRVIAGYNLFKVVLNSVISQLSDAKYDETSFEQLADHFPSRFGYGRSLITALDKMHVYFDNPEKAQSYNTFNVLSTMRELYFTTILLAGSIIGMGPIGGILAILFISLLIRISGEDIVDYTYDKLKIRYKRIRATYIDAIKDLNIPKDELKAIIDNIYAVDRIINETHVVTSLYNKISNVLFSKASKANIAIREQQLMEDLAFNDLFLQSASFRTL